MNKKIPTPRNRIYDLYWYFASERQRIFEKRVAGAIKPWTDDWIMQDFKFCNVFRSADRVSQYLIRDVAYSEERSNPIDRLFQIVAFRIFSKIETWKGVQELIGRSPTLNDLSDNTLTSALDRIREVNGGLYTGAFILCANNAYGHSLKHRNHIELFRHMFLKDSLGEKLLETKSLREVFNLLHEFPLMGDFMSYQIAIDLNYSDLVNFNENEFTKPGPGAVRGIKKAFESLGDFSPEEVIMWMVDQQEKEFKRLGLQFNGLWGRPLHAIDCQGLFCELDKYCREAAPDLRSKRKRIKTRFSQSKNAIKLFFPPKWGINSFLPQHLVFGREDEKKGDIQLVLI